MRRALALLMVALPGCVSAPPAPAREPSLYLRLLNSYVRSEELEARGTAEMFLGHFRHIGSFVRRPEGTVLHVCVASVRIPAALSLHGRTEFLIQDDDGRIVFQCWPKEENLCVVDGELRLCHDGNGAPLDGPPLLRLEHPGLVDFLNREAVGADGWAILEYEPLSIDWDRGK